MMKADQDKWNAKYRAADQKEAICPAVKRYCKLAPSRNRALDLASGLGDNAIFLAGRGFRVEAVDISDVAMARLKGKHPKVTPICADLDSFEIDPGIYDLIINIHFLNRRLFPLIKEGLKAGGILIFETFMEGDPNGTEASTCRDYLLRPNELLHAFLPLHILFYEERRNIPPIRASHVATLVARKN